MIVFEFKFVISQITDTCRCLQYHLKLVEWIEATCNYQETFITLIYGQLNQGKQYSKFYYFTISLIKHSLGIEVFSRNNSTKILEIACVTLFSFRNSLIKYLVIRLQDAVLCLNELKWKRKQNKTLETLQKGHRGMPSMETLL